MAKSLPALWRAEKLQKKAAKAGFDWVSVEGAMDKIDEEAGELREVLSDRDRAAEELGDLLFSCVNVARFLKVDPEEALRAASDKFLTRFARLEKAAMSRGLQLEDMTLEQMDEIWDEVK